MMILTFLMLIAIMAIPAAHAFQRIPLSTSRRALAPMQMATLPIPVPTAEAGQKALSNLFGRLPAAPKGMNVAKFFQVSTIAAFLVSFREKITAKLQKASKEMEDGWKTRGSGSAFARTVEIWSFAISFAFLAVRIIKSQAVHLEYD